MVKQPSKGRYPFDVDKFFSHDRHTKKDSYDPQEANHFSLGDPASSVLGSARLRQDFHNSSSGKEAVIALA
jgi:hypothetical protein